MKYSETFSTSKNDQHRLSVFRTLSSLKDWNLYIKSLKRLYSFHNRYKGERCFIIGNGPSLKYTDLSVLKNEITFGLNRIYLLFPKLGFSTTYLVTINKYVIEQFRNEILRVPSQKFISWYFRHSIPFNDDLIFIRPIQKVRFSTNPIFKGMWDGTTVTYIAMQLAYFMGFKKVILVGVDHSFVTKGSAHQLVTSEGDDKNHFDPNYFGKGVKWQLPDLVSSEKAYKLAKQYFEADKREILDATIGGCLNIFKKIDYTKIFI